MAKILRPLPAALLAAILASRALAAPAAALRWSDPAPRSAGGETLLSCPEGGCAWSFAPRTPLALDTLGFLEVAVSASKAAEVPGLELVALWEDRAAGFEPLVPSERKTVERVSLRPVWVEGEDPDLSRPPLGFELRWTGSSANGAEVRLSGWRWLSLRPNPDEIGKFGPYAEMLPAVEALKEGAKPPYSGPRGERVENARRVHAKLWSADRRSKPEEDLALWKEGRRWMAQAWVLLGPTSSPAPGEARLFWTQEPREEWADSLARAGATGLVEEVRFELFGAGGKPVLRDRAASLSLDWIPALSLVRTPAGASAAELAEWNARGWLQRDPNGEPRAALSLCSDEVRALAALTLSSQLAGLGAGEIFVDDLELPFGDETDYGKACEEGFAKLLGAREVPGWPASVFPDSALHARFAEFRRAALDSFVAEIARAAADAGVRLSAVVEDDPVRALEEKGQNWTLWAEKGWVSSVAPRLFDADLGRFRARLARWSAVARKIAASRKAAGLPPLGVLPTLSTWETVSWSERQDLALQLEQIGAARAEAKGARGLLLFTANEAWIRHDAAWVARGALRPHTP